MSQATFVQDGDNLDYTPETAKSSGDVVLHPCGLAGLVNCDTPAGELGSVKIRGVVNAPIHVDSLAFLGESDTAYWDDTLDVITHEVTNAGFTLGRTVAVYTDGTADVLLNGQ